MIRSESGAWRNIFSDLSVHGIECAPRGQMIKEIEDYQIDVDPIKEVFCPFPERKLNLRYFAGELAWYLRGDLNDRSIVEYSKFWDQIKNNSAPLWNSNYGHYIFKLGQFKNAVDSLLEDKDSRQAAMIISRPDVIMSRSKDKICTNAIMFRIRQDRLNMTVQMRSNDAVLGLGYDMPIFGLIYEMVYECLKVKYRDLQIGRYAHVAASFHIYEKHFALLDQQVWGQPEEKLDHVDLPRLNGVQEVNQLRYTFPTIERNIREKGVMIEPSVVLDFFPPMVVTLSKWLVENDNSK